MLRAADPLCGTDPETALHLTLICYGWQWRSFSGKEREKLFQQGLQRQRRQSRGGWQGRLPTVWERRTPFGPGRAGCPLGRAAGAWSRLLGACGGKGPSVERPPCPEPILWPLGPGQPRKAGRPSQEDTRPREPRLSLPCPSPFPPSLALGTRALGHPFCFQTCSHLRHLGAPSPTPAPSPLHQVPGPRCAASPS